VPAAQADHGGATAVKLGDELRAIGITERHLANTALVTTLLAFPSPPPAAEDRGSSGSSEKAAEEPEPPRVPCHCHNCRAMPKDIRRVEEILGLGLVKRREADTTAEPGGFVEFEVAARFFQPDVDDFVDSFQSELNGDSGVDRRPPASKRIQVVLIGEMYGESEPSGKFFILRVHCYPDQVLYAHSSLLSSCQVKASIYGNRPAENGGPITPRGHDWWRQNGQNEKADIFEAVDALVPADMEALSCADSTHSAGRMVEFEELSIRQQKYVEGLKKRLEKKLGQSK